MEEATQAKPATFIGTKQVKAIAMNRAEYNTLRGWTLPADEDGADAGYLVEYLDGGKPNMAGFEGYVSWSPAEQFENAYRPTQGMPFGLALEAVRKGLKVARAGWNGKGMWLSLSPGSKALNWERFWSPANRAYAQAQPGGGVDVLPCITMKTAGGEILMGWLASQTDMLSDDWVIVD